jgi:peroxiredoxin
MKNSTLQFAFLFLVILQMSCNSPLEKCTITGRVIGRSSSSLILINALERPDPSQAKIHIPIKDSTFSYEFNANPKQAYWLIFEDDFTSGGFFPITIFPDKEKIKLILYDSKHIAQNKIYGGELNKQFASFTEDSKLKFDPIMRPYNDSIEVLSKRNNYFSEEFKELEKETQKTTNKDSLIVIYKKMADLGDNALSKPVKEINRHLDSIYKEKYLWCYNYYAHNQTIVSYYLILNELMYSYNDNKYSDISKIKNLVENISAKYPGHPYDSVAKDLIGAIDRIKVGGKFIDFTLPDLNGNKITLSKTIEGKIALIDLWATWCGPCISTSKSMIPVYNEFKNSGFTIIGVAREFDNTNQLEKTLEREKFPWINLVELNNQNGIWIKYGKPTAGGGTFLVDKNGKILAIEPTAEEVRNILTEKLK